MTREQAIEKLKKIKELAERGVGGEKTSAIEIYKKIVKKYNIENIEIVDTVELRWFPFKTPLEERLLIQILYKVTGNRTYWFKCDKRKHLRGVECTEFEAEEINFYFEIYRKALSNQLKLFIEAFIRSNDIYPDETTRIKEEQCEFNILTDEEWERSYLIAKMAEGIEKTQVHKQIETNN